MTRDLLIGVDAGTSVIKAVAFDVTGKQIAVASRRNHYVTLPHGGVEQDMRRTWQDTVAVLRELGERIDGLAERALALSVTGQGDGCWLIDKEGEPIHDGWLAVTGVVEKTSSMTMTKGAKADLAVIQIYLDCETMAGPAA